MTRSALGNERVDVASQDHHRHTAAHHHRIVELAEVELVAEGLLRLLAQTVDPAVTHFVTTRLARPRAVTIDLARDLVEARAIGAREPLDRLLTRPALRVQSGIDDQTTGAKRNRLQITQPTERIIVINAELASELLGIQRPTFREGIEREQRTEQ